MSGYSVYWLFSVSDFPASNPAFSRGRGLVSFYFENRLLGPEHRNLQQQTCISPEPAAKANRQWGPMGWMLVDHRDGLPSSSLFSLILDSPVRLSAGIQSAGDSVPETLWAWILFSAEEDNLSHIESKTACLCQSIEINNNKYVHRQSQVRMPNGSGIEWAEYSLVIGTGCWGQFFFSLILESSVGLSAGIQSAGDSFPETLWVQILHSAEEDNLSPIDLKIAFLCQNIEINRNKNQTICLLQYNMHKIHLNSTVHAIPS